MGELTDARGKLLEVLRVSLEQMSREDFFTARDIIGSIQFKLDLNKKSESHASVKKSDAKKLHPVRPNRAEIYNVLLSIDNVGTELNGNHPCVIVSNQKKNIYSEKVNVVPIEGDGKRIDKMNHIKITNQDLIEGHLSKDPSRVIGGDVMTIDKSRLDKKIGKLKPEKMTDVMTMVKNQLGL